jgi:hypothetical protein
MDPFMVRNLVYSHFVDICKEGHLKNIVIGNDVEVVLLYEEVAVSQRSHAHNELLVLLAKVLRLSTVWKKVRDVDGDLLCDRILEEDAFTLSLVL